MLGLWLVLLPLKLVEDGCFGGLGLEGQESVE